MTTVDTSERNFEESIETALTGPAWQVAESMGGYLAGEPGAPYRRLNPAEYDRALCLHPETLFEFLYTTQPQTWERLKKQHGEGHVKERFLRRLMNEIRTRGTLDVLRRGVTDLGCKFDLVYFRPETGLNDEHRRLYRANILGVMRQVRYSLKNENSLDMVLFLNGLPLFTAELKTPLKGQTIEHAMAQYRRDRDPREPLFAFGRCLAHFAVDPDLVYLTTHLRGTPTRFLPFNRGQQGGAGNPENPQGFKTAYLWEHIWQRDSLLDILSHFLQVVDIEDDKGKKTGERELIFPRYHQLMAVRSLVDHARQQGAGQRYLIEHSAGSGKSNSIAWLAHRLAGLHDAQDARVFDSIIVITDRRILDRQLRRTVRSFAQVRDLVAAVEHSSVQLREALEAGRNIIVTTLQKFPFVVEHIGKLPGRHFAVIIDEAHSSQTGESTSSLRRVLMAASLEEAQAEEAQAAAPDPEDDINAVVEAALRARGRLPHISFFAFTATPKAKTLELFGTQRADGTFVPFSLYSMRQAIEEGFILDVLKHYTTFRVYFSLLKNTPRDPSYNRQKALALLKAYADLHEHAIETKTALMVEHFHEHVRHRIGGQAKAMVVTRSRLHAVRYRQAFDRYLRERGYPYQALVAFSGQVRDPDTGFTFTEAGMNGFPETQTADTFKQAQYRILIVANKFQTGFDQPLLHTMYVDKKLGGVNAVQTLSRLNRPAPDKEDTLVLDFANRADEIRQAFQPYYEATLLTEATDPNKLYDFQRMLEDYRLFDWAAVEAFAAVYFAPGGTQARLHALLDPVVTAFRQRDAEEQAGFRKHLLDYVRLYAFLSQVLTFADADLEKLYQFARHLLRKLPVGRDRLPVEITANINMDSYRIQQTSSGQIALLQADGALQPITDLGTGVPTQSELAPLSEIVAYINEHYGTTFTTEDKLHHFTDDMERRMAANVGLVRALDTAINPSEDTRRLAFDHVFGDTLEDMIDANFDIYKKLVDDPTFGEIFRRIMFSRIVDRIAAGGASA